MKNKLKGALSQVRAEEQLKDSTRAFLARKTQGYAGTKAVKVRWYLYACACLFLCLLGGHWLYFTPTAEIGIDINPSIELGVNRFDRVISVKGLNEDGQDLTKELDIKYRSCEDALERILDHDKIMVLLAGNEIMTITVTGPEGTQSFRILSEIEACTAEQGNMYCYFAPPEEVAAAREMGLSYGKYRAFLEVRSLDPEITPEMVQGMTMREIRDLIAILSTGNKEDISGSGNGGTGQGNGGNGSQGSGSGNRGNRGNGSQGFGSGNGGNGIQCPGSGGETGQGNRGNGSQGSGSGNRGNGRRNGQ